MGVVVHGIGELDRGRDPLLARVTPLLELAMPLTIFPAWPRSHISHSRHINDFGGPCPAGRLVVRCCPAMVAVYFEHNEPTRRSRVLLATPLIWRVLMGVDSGLVALTGRLEVTSDLPAYLRGRTVLLAANHVGVFDVFVLIAACRRLGIAPKFLATGGLFDAKFVGPVGVVTAMPALSTRPRSRSIRRAYLK